MATVSLPNKIYAGNLTNIEEQIYTVLAGETDVITSATLCNLTDVAQTATLKFGGVFFFKNIDLAPRQVTILDFKQVLNAGDAIVVGASNNDAVSLFLSSVKITVI